jgi:hypothetical protein
MSADVLSRAYDGYTVQAGGTLCANEGVVTSRPGSAVGCTIRLALAAHGVGPLCYHDRERDGDKGRPQ